MKYFTYILFIIFTACRYFEEKPSEKELLDKQLKSINWQKVDKFPCLLVCEVLENESDQKKCFLDYIKQTISEKLNSEVKKNWGNKNDSLLVKVTISKNGTIDFSAINKIEKDSIIKTALYGFPRVVPAIKRSMLVDSEFILKVLYKTN